MQILFASIVIEDPVKRSVVPTASIAILWSCCQTLLETRSNIIEVAIKHVWIHTQSQKLTEQQFRLVEAMGDVGSHTQNPSFWSIVGNRISISAAEKKQFDDEVKVYSGERNLDTSLTGNKTAKHKEWEQKLYKHLNGSKEYRKLIKFIKSNFISMAVE